MKASASLDGLAALIADLRSQLTAKA